MEDPIVLTERMIDQMAKDLKKQRPDIPNVENRARQILEKCKDRPEELMMAGLIVLLEQGKE